MNAIEATTCKRQSSGTEKFGIARKPARAFQGSEGEGLEGGPGRQEHFPTEWIAVRGDYFVGAYVQKKRAAQGRVEPAAKGQRGRQEQ